MSHRQEGATRVRRQKRRTLTLDKPIKLYHHRTDGGAEYLFDKYVVCPNGEKEGVVEGANVMIRLDGKPTLCINNPLLESAPALLAALKDLLTAPDVTEAVCRHCGRVYEDQPNSVCCPADDCPGYQGRQAIAVAEGGRT